jgi:hypothetical protein
LLVCGCGALDQQLLRAARPAAHQHVQGVDR